MSPSESKLVPPIQKTMEVALKLLAILLRASLELIMVPVRALGQILLVLASEVFTPSAESMNNVVRRLEGKLA